jgi:SCY1-like protein 2
MGTLAVQEAMGFKVDREAVATLVLPQLWALSMGPCALPSTAISPPFLALFITYSRRSIPVLNLQQFDRFMDVIRKLGERVAKEHNQFLRDNQRIGDKSGLHAADGSDGLNGAGMGLGGSSNGNGGAINFESLVGQAGAGMSVKQDSSATPSWDDDPWGSILATTSEVEPFTAQM